MTAPFAAVRNAVPIDRRAIPVLAIEEWRQTILELCRGDVGRIVALFGVAPDPHTVQVVAVVGIDAEHVLRVAAVDCTGVLRYPALTPDLPQAHNFERELCEEFGITPDGHPFLKPLRRHAGYAFARIAGEGIHEVAVGPVHAGLIEPGHFRFQCHGEQVLHLEIQLGYQHRGVEPLLVAASPARRMILAESIAGDTVIGHGIAYAQAMEALCGVAPPARAASIRAIALELERLANHAGDLGALAGEIGFLTAQAYYGRARGDYLNLLLALSGNRFGRGLLQWGGVGFDCPADMVREFQQQLVAATTDFDALEELFFSATSVLSRMEQTGTLPPEVARQLGCVGPTARASHLPRDVRHDYPTAVYQHHPMTPIRLPMGDVYARSRLRALEGKRALAFVAERLANLEEGSIACPVGALRVSITGARVAPPRDVANGVPWTPANTSRSLFHFSELAGKACWVPPSPPLCGLEISHPAMVVSLVEGWRGEIAHIACTDADGELLRYKIVDPSFHNWWALGVVMQNAPISDFPLCNKSFNLSYAGHDL